MPDNPDVSSSVFVEDVRVIQQHEYPHRQYVLRLDAPRCAAAARPGQFIHLQCDPALRMRRPYSIMSVSPQQGWIEILYQVVGAGSRLLSEKRSGVRLSSIGPVGRGFVPHRERIKPLLLGGGVGIPPVFFLAQSLKRRREFEPFAVLASERPFPFQVGRSEMSFGGIERNISATHAALEAMGVAARLCSKRRYPGCFDGFIDELAQLWLSHLHGSEKSRVEIFACGPRPMLRAVAALARRHQLPCQLCVEEYMACALGGCAGCAVEVIGSDGVDMKRVCVDGPVFDAASLRF